MSSLIGRINLIRGLDRLVIILIIPIAIYGCLSPSTSFIRCGDFIYSLYIQRNAVELYSLEGDELSEPVNLRDKLIPVKELQGEIEPGHSTPAERPNEIKGRYFRLSSEEAAQRIIGILACGKTQLERYARYLPRKAQLDRAYLAGGDLDGALVNGGTYCAGFGPDRLYLMPRVSQRLDIRFLKALGYGILIAIVVSALSRIVALTLICLRWLLTGAVDLTLYCLRWVLRGFVDKEIQKENINI